MSFEFHTENIVRGEAAAHSLDGKAVLRGRGISKGQADYVKQARRVNP